MRKIIFPLQKIALFLFYLQQMIQAPHLFFAIFSSMFIILSILIEGGRPYTPLLIMIAILNWFQYTIAQVILVVITGILMVTMKFYHINVPKQGKFKVGYKKQSIGKLHICIFYPTCDQNSNQKTMWFTKNHMRVIYQLLNAEPLNSRPPYWIFSFILSYLYKIEIPVLTNANLHLSQGSSELLVWSHGLGATMHAYSSICCYWASHGRIIISVSHQNDKIRLDYRSLKDQGQIAKYLYEKRNRDLKVRANQVLTVINQLRNNQLLNKIFNAQIKIQRVYLGGHSYGGCTALEAYITLKASANSDLIQGLILLDPWLFPLSQIAYITPIQVKTLILNTHTFYERIPKRYELQNKLKILKSLNKENLICLMIKKIDHIQQSDMIYTFGTFLKTIGKSNLQQFADYIMQINQYIIQMFKMGVQQQQIIKNSNQFIQVINLNKLGVQVKQQWRFTHEETMQEFEKRKKI